MASDLIALNYWTPFHKKSSRTNDSLSNGMKQPMTKLALLCTTVISSSKKQSVFHYSNYVKINSITNQYS